MVKVHYFYDPMCGWCYGASALLDTLQASDNIEIIYHPGGMIKRQTIESSFKAHILKNDQAIAIQTEAVFGTVYKARIQSNESLVFDSYIAIQAIFVAQENGIAPLRMLKAIQSAHFQQGKQIQSMQTLQEIAVAEGLDANHWQKQMQQAESKVVKLVQVSHQLMANYQVQGYPTLIAETVNGPKHLAHTDYYQNMSGWK